ncbi:reverse transcriptase-like protein [Terribacillus saccharophilus]|uniref:reverse transcriptase-like protein n=1 Tax=Terribacillus saccharophilus TaxID=361277 RepID=UPI002DCFD820|nr:reverse transcriptase-like protein [Terribacillus saccharophilus]MEC0289513.1 reverse transcriptase-like protein [Terribacillus saccharophilus]
MKLRMKMTYRTPKGTEAEFLSDYLPPGAVLLLMEDMQQSGRIPQIEILDQYETEWSIKELRNYMKELVTEPHNVRVYVDGGFDKGTGKGGLGCVIHYEQNQKEYRLRRNQEMEQLISNNEAEYAALHFAIGVLSELGVKEQEIEVFTDSRTVVNQMSDEWPVYEKELKYWADKVDDLVKEIGLTVQYDHVDRKKNKEADQLASQALRSIQIDSTIQK